MNLEVLVVVRSNNFALAKLKACLAEVVLLERFIDSRGQHGYHALVTLVTG